jgi:hypothetical protein
MTLICISPFCPNAYALPEAKVRIPAGYSIYQSVKLKSAQTGIQGFLQILQDERVTPVQRKKWGESRDPSLAAKLQPPLRNGSMRLINSQGQVIAEEKFEVPLGKIETANLYNTDFPTYLVSTDYGIGMGSYAGPATEFVEIRNGKFEYIHVMEDKSKRLSLLDSHNVSDSIQVRRFQQEAKAEWSLSHPNLVQVHDFGILENGQPYLVMDIVQALFSQEDPESRTISGIAYCTGSRRQGPTGELDSRHVGRKSTVSR